MVVAAGGRDIEDVQRGLTRWLTVRNGAPVDIRLTSSAQGFSSETYFVEVDGQPPLVVRLPPVGAGLLPEYDLAFQARLQGAVADLGIKAARPIAYVDDLEWVGAPFIVMPKLRGQIVEDNPHYATAGWLHDASPEAQRDVFTSFVDALAGIHRADMTTLAFARRANGPGLDAELSWWREYLQFASAGEPPAELGDAMSWLASDIPQQRPPDSLIWGDPRLGNVIFQGTNVAGIVDWEMAAIAPAEVDLAWFFALRPSRPELPGFLDRRATIERYEARLGRPTHDLEWYEAFALVRSTSILVRMQQLLRQRGDTDHFLVGIDPIPPRLRRLLAE